MRHNDDRRPIFRGGWSHSILGALLSVLWLLGLLATQSPYLHQIFHGHSHVDEHCAHAGEQNACEGLGSIADDEDHGCVVALLDIGVEHVYTFEVALLYRGVWTALRERSDPLVARSIARTFDARAPPAVTLA